MKKLLLVSGLIATGVSFAQVNDEAAERAKDHAQPVPDASVTVRKVTESTATILTPDGNSAVTTTTSVTVDNSATGQTETVTSSEVVLPQAKIVNGDMNFAQTLNKMQSTFSKLMAADSVQAMQIPTNVLSDYAGQASALLASGADLSGVTVTDLELFKSDLNQFRVLLVELQRALIANDLALAKTKIEVIAQAQDGLFGYFTP